MPEAIEKLLSKQAIDDFVILKNNVNDSVDSIEKLIALGVQLNNTLGKANTFKEINKSAAELAANEAALVKQMTDLQKENAKLNKLYEDQAKKIEQLTNARKKGGTGGTGNTQLTKEQEKLTKAESDDAKQLAILVEQRKRADAANRQSAKEALGMVDAYGQLEQEYKKAAREAQNLSVQFGANSAEAQEASARALELDVRLKAADAAVGRFNRNVGNYSGALKILEKGLVDVKNKIDAYTKSGQSNEAVIEQLRKEETLLTNLLKSQEAGFAKATQEIKANTVALQQMAAAGLEGTEAYNELFKATADLKDQTADLATSLKNAAPDDIAFNAAADAARGLIGLYGLAKSATAAFGLENEAFEETLVKLQAAETALQSIEAIRMLFKKESAFQQAITIGLQKIEILQTRLQTAAESKNIIVKYAAIAAQKALNLVMSLAGGPMLAIIGLLALLVISLSSFSSATAEAIKNFKALNAEFDNNERLLNDRTEAIKQASEIEVAELEAAFASESKIRAARKKALADEIREVARFAAENGKNYQAAYDLSRSLLLRQQQGEELSEKDKEALDESTAFVNKYIANRKRQTDLDTAFSVMLADNRKEETEESIKARQRDIENIRTVTADKKAILEKDADDETKIFEDRIEAQRKANELSIKLINDQARSQRLTPGQSPSELRVIETQRQTAIAAAKRDGEAKLKALNKERLQRERLAQFEIAKISIELQAEAAQKIAANQNKNLEDRLFAQYEYFKAQETLVKGNLNNELANANLTATERKAAEERANAEILRLRMQFIDDSNAIMLESLEDQNADSVSRLNTENARAIIALNERFEAGKISAAEYYKTRQRLEIGFENESLALQIKNLKKLSDEKAKQGIDVTQINEEIALREMELSDLTTQKKLEDLEKVKAAQQQLGQEIFDLFSTLVVAGYEKEKNAIQEQIDLNEEKKEQDIAIATQTITDKQKLADEVAIIEAKAAAQREALERRQRQLDQQRARFEKQQTIAKIILDTARAVIAALTSTPPNVPLSIYVGAIGAVSLARAIATPIPAYAKGTNSAEGGISLVGDAYRREWMISPTGEVFSTPAVPTLMNVEKGTRIYASDQKALEAGVFGDVHALPALTDTGSHYKYMTDKLGNKLDGVRNEIRRGNRMRTARTTTGWETIKTHGTGKQKQYYDKGTK